MISLATALSLLLLNVAGHASTAPTYDLNLELTVGDLTPTKARLAIIPNKPASLIREIDGEKVFLTVTAHESRVVEDKGVLLEFAVGTLNAKGEKTVMARPRISALEDERALASDGKVSVAVVAKPL